MKQHAYSCTVVAMIVAGSRMPAAAQQSNDEWRVLVEPYMMGAAMNGTTTIGGAKSISMRRRLTSSRPSVRRDRSRCGDQGKWGFGTDVIWMSLGTTVSARYALVGDQPARVERDRAPVLELAAPLRLRRPRASRLRESRVAQISRCPGLVVPERLWISDVRATHHAVEARRPRRATTPGHSN